MNDTTTLDDTDVVIEQATEKAVPADVVSSEQSTELPRAQLDDLAGVQTPSSNEDVGLEIILDVPVTVTLELGRTTLTVRDLLQLNQGSVVEFDRRVGEPLDLLVNGTLLAHGELVVIDDGFGIRLTEVMSPKQRLEKLN